MAKGGELIFDSDPIWHNIKSDFKLVCLSDCGIKSRRLLYYQLPPTTTSTGAIFYGVIVYLCPPAPILFSYPSVAAAAAIPRLVMDEDEDELCIDRSLGRNTHPHTS